MIEDGEILIYSRTYLLLDLKNILVFAQVVLFHFNMFVKLLLVDAY